MGNNFYTYVKSKSNKLYVRGIKNGKRYSRVVNYSPRLYQEIRPDTPEINGSEWMTLFDKPLKELNFRTIAGANDYINECKESGRRLYGMKKFEYQYILDRHGNDKDKWDFKDILVYSIDIETETEHGFPDINKANEKITLITLNDINTGKSYTFGAQEYNGDQDINYIKCESEEDLLNEFISFWSDNCPDIVTGWNIDMFDIPYLVNRITLVCGKESVLSLSPFNKILNRTTYYKARKVSTYDLMGIESLDYFNLYLKYTYKSHESNSLDYISSIELGVTKLKNPHATFKDFYTKSWDLFVEYNIRDAELVSSLENKLGLINLHVLMAYEAGVNYGDMFKSVPVWDVIIYRHLHDKHIAIPPQEYFKKEESYAGGYVKPPVVGKHKWVASFDLNSLYPHLIMQFNIGYETLIRDEKYNVSVDDLVDRKFDNSILSDNVCLSANGRVYSKSRPCVLGNILREMYTKRVKIKSELLELQKNDKNSPAIVKLHNLQKSLKIMMNIAYGAIGNEYFRYYDSAVAESVSMSGQLAIKWSAKAVNEGINKLCKDKDKDYIIAIDTDSIYISFDDIVNKLYRGDKDNKSSVIDFIDKVSNDFILKVIDKSYKEMHHYLNTISQEMEMKREIIADQAIWTAKKRYILNVYDNEGVRYQEPEIKVMGLEMVKSSTPHNVRDMLKAVIPYLFMDSPDSLVKFVAECKEKFNKMPLEDIASPRGVNVVDKYLDKSTIYKKGTPIQAKAALVYNHLIDKLNLDKKYVKISDGDKIKYIYLSMPNTIKQTSIGFLDTLPTEFNLEKYIDKEMQFNKVFITPLELITNSMGWSISNQGSLF